MMSKTPISASRLAAVVAGMPWSCAAGMKWVPIRPLVDQPQIQKTGRAPRTSSAARPGPASAAASRAGPGSPGSAPAGSSRARRRTAARRRPRAGRASRAGPQAPAAAAKTATSPAAQRQPGSSASRAIVGRKTSWPVELAAEKTPVTRPRWLTNQRFATIAPKTSAIAPVPTPIGTPHRNQSCHDWVITRVSPAPRPPAGGLRRRPDGPEPFHQRRRKGCGEPVDHQVEADRPGGRAPRPAELVLERLQQRARSTSGTRPPPPGPGA